MKNPTYNRLKNFTSFLFFFSYGATAFAMDGEPIFPVIAHNDGVIPIIPPKKTFTIFDPRKTFTTKKYATHQCRTPWKEIVPGSITITPDEKGVILTKPGQVHHLDFNTFATPPTLLFEHASVKHCPMITVASQKNNEQSPDTASLVIVSAGNYEDPDKEENISEYIIYREDAPYQIHKLKKYIQLIKISSNGEMLVIGEDHRITVVDREKNDSDMVNFRDQLLMDVAISPDNTKIVCIGSQGALKLITVTRMRDKINAYAVKQVTLGDMITSISYPDQKKLFYLTDSGEAKIIEMYDVLENSSFDSPARTIENYDVKSIAGGNVPSSVFVEHTLHDVAVIDQNSQNSVVYSIIDGRNNSHHIIVCCECGKFIQKYILTMPHLEKTYEYITETRQTAHARGRLFLLALRGSSVVAVGTDGKMYLWGLHLNKIDDQTSPIAAVTPPIPVTDKPKQKKSSSFLRVLKGSSGSGSKDSSKSSSTPSEETSPRSSHTKRENSTTSLACNESGNEGL